VNVTVCGSGLAARMTVAALASGFSDSIRLTHLECMEPSGADLFYGNLAGPSAYSFNLAAGVTEPRLLLETDTTLSWGTKYSHWGARRRSWTQCFHLPFPVIGGVPFHQYLTRLGLGELEPFLASAVAAHLGRFAHPLEDGPPPLARAEYGYHFDPASYQAPFAVAAAKHVRHMKAEIRGVELDERGIASLHLSDGRRHAADLYVDCTGLDAGLISRIGPPASGTRQLCAVSSTRSVDAPSLPVRVITAGDFGWQAETSLQGGVARLTVYHPEAAAAANAAHGAKPARIADATLGRRAQPWFANCVAVGLAARVIEPLTPAPMLLLQRDIERLLSLIPLSADMAVERREYNRQAADDDEHAGLFTHALLEPPGATDAPYWRAAREDPLPEKLAGKISQFESRGILVAYDHEPFNAEDWTILHFGMGRQPARYDRLADRLPGPEVLRHLANMRRNIEELARSLPPHREYVAGMIRHLEQQGRSA
jgi:tryptophan halogenase